MEPLTLAFLLGAGVLVLNKPKKSVSFKNEKNKISKIKINSSCNAFISPSQLKISGFGYDLRSYGLSGLFLNQYEWKQDYEDQLIFLYNSWMFKEQKKIEEIFTDFLPNTLHSILCYFYNINCEPKKFDKNTISLIEYLQIDIGFLILLVLYKNKILSEELFKEGIYYIIENQEHYVYSDQKPKIISTKDDVIINYYKNLFKILPTFVSISPLYLSEIEMYKSSIKYDVKENVYRFYKYGENDVKRLIKLIAKAQYETA